MRKAFTMIELIFSIVVIGIISVVALSKFKVDFQSNTVAYEIADDIAYAAHYVYLNPTLAHKFEDHLNDNLGFPRAMRFSVRSFPGLIKESKATVGDKFADTNGFEIFENYAYEYVYSGDESAVPLRDPSIASARKYFIFARPGQNANSAKQVMQMASPHVRLKPNNLTIEMFKLIPDDKKDDVSHVIKLGKNAGPNTNGEPAFFYFDPLYGGFLIPKKQDIIKGAAVINEHYAIRMQDPYYAHGRIVIRVRPSNEDLEKLDDKRFTCFGINPGSYAVETLPRNDKDEQIAFYKLENGEIKARCTCKQLNNPISCD